jgi:hypothetical protein
MSLLAPTPGACFGTVLRDGVAYACPRTVVWCGTLRTTRNGLSWEADACEHHGRKLMNRYRISSAPVASVAGHGR